MWVVDVTNCNEQFELGADDVLGLVNDDDVRREAFLELDLADVHCCMELGLLF
jgi:hypothetical protein